jgi:sensor histidine kinase YesM
MQASGMNRKLSTAAGIVLCCIGFGAIPAVIELVFGGIGPRQFGEWTLHGVIYAFCIAIPCSTVIPRVLCRLDTRAAWVRPVATVSMLGIFATTGTLAANLIMLAFHLIHPAEFRQEFWFSFRIAVLMTFASGLIMTAFATLQSRLSSVKEELERREVAEERARKVAAEARFASLQSRVHPHFLFNTLNSISALVREDPAQAERTIERLAALLRFSLDSEVAGVVTLREELRIVRDYLEIEKVRFGDRLRYRIEVDSSADEHSVPALSVQTLVENSVKYAVGARREGAEIVVRANVRDGRLRIEVSDDGPGFAPEISVKPGHGLDLVRQRLTALFGASAALEMSARDGHTLVAISVAA